MKSAVLLVSLVVMPLQATEFFVNKNGSDDNDGQSRESAFLTIRKGVDTLEEGDILTIGPGEYFEKIERDGLGGGDPEKTTVIRAEFPGTVLLHGDVPAPEFKPLAGTRFTFVADFSGPVEAVAELDTLKLMDKSPSLAELELRPGICYFDDTVQKLYISTSDFEPPASHKYRVLVTADCGMRLSDAERVLVDGLAFRGFYRFGQTSLNFSKDYIWGLILTNPRSCEVRNCIAYLNGGGICLHQGHDNIVDSCLVYANSNLFGTEVAGIFRLFGNNDVIRNCRAFNSQNAGIRYYLGVRNPETELRGPFILRDNLSWGNASGDFWIKTGESAKYGYAERCISGGAFHVGNITNCLMGGGNAYRRNLGMPADSMRMPAAQARREKNYADPLNFDFRLQSTSEYRGKGVDGGDPGPFPYKAEVFYVDSRGNDQAEGTAVTLAWRTVARAVQDLKKGDTLYLLAGEYDATDLSGLEGVNLRGRGTDEVVIRGEMNLHDCRDVTVERLIFPDGCRVAGGSAVVFENCLFGGLDVSATGGLTLRHCEVYAVPEFKESSDLFLAGNIFSHAPELAESQIAYSDYNSFSSREALDSMPDRHSHVIEPVAPAEGEYGLQNAGAFAGLGPNATAIGRYRMFSKRTMRLAGPYLHSASDTTANVEWHATQPAICHLAWGETPDCTNKTTRLVNDFGTFSLTGLKPGTKYFFRILSVEPSANLDYFDTLPLEPQDALLEFETSSTAIAPRTWHVAVEGDDRADGLTEATAWGSVRHAAAQVSPGDTVLVGAGSYRERVPVRRTGEEGRPITFRAAPGHKVVFDAGNRELNNAFVINSKKHLHFDGFYFHGYGLGNHDLATFAPRSAGIFQVYQAGDIKISRCFMNGLGRGYSPGFMAVSQTDGLLLENSVICSGFGGMSVRSSGNIVLRNNVYLRNLISASLLLCGPDDKIQFLNNIVTDSLPAKQKVRLFEVSSFESLEENSNCFYLRIPPEERITFIFYRKKDREGRNHYMTLPEYWREKSVENKSLAGDPVFAGTLEMERKNAEGRPVYLADRLLARGRDLDFPDLFATDPELVARGIGLQPDAFQDFWFSAAPPQ